MKIFKPLGLFLVLLISSSGIAQDAICDDFRVAPWPTDGTSYSAGELVGYSQDGTQPITVGVGSECSFGPGSGGIYVWNYLNFAFDGESQLATFEIYGIEEQYPEMGFTVNGSPLHSMDETFPMTIDGVTIDLDDSAVDFDDWDNAYLIFTGDIDEIDIVGFESGINTLCVEPLFDEDDCDDFRLAPWPSDGTSYSAGELVGYSQDGTQPITVGVDSDCSFGPGATGIYVWNYLNFAFDGENQLATFEIYGIEEQYPEMGFTVNGSPLHSMDETFPMTIDGVTIDLDDSAVDFDDWDNAYLIFAGEIDEIDIVGFESGITTLCVESLFDEDDCDDFTNVVEYPEDFSPIDADMIGDIIGTTQGGTQPITIGAVGDGWLEINNWLDEGFYGGCELDFAFDGSNQIARFLIYGGIDDGTTIGFSVNGSTLINYDEIFPMVVDGVTVEMDLSPEDFDGSWESFYLILTGEIDVVSLLLFESGIQELCVEPILGTDVPCEDFTGEPWPIDEIFESGEIIGYTQDGVFPVTVGDEGSVYVNTDPIYFPGLFINNAPVMFEFDGSDQTVQFEIYEWFGAGSEGFELNGEALILFDDTYPMTVDGVVIDLELSGLSVGTAELAHMTFSGELDEIVMVGGELGITGICYESDSTILVGAGLIDYNDQLISVYPNPADEFVTINSNDPIQSVRIYAITGELVLSLNDSNKNQITLNTGELEQGLYLVELFLSNGTRLIEKVIIE